MNFIEIFLLSTAALLILCVFASKAAGKLGIPTLVIFIGIGALAGSEGLGGIYFDNASQTQALGIIALSYILFSGGLGTKWKSIQPVLKSGISLATIGVIITCVSVGLFTHFVLGFSILEGLLIGAIISSTDAGAVFTVLRSKSIHLKSMMKPLLEFESGANDPTAVFLTTLILGLMQSKEHSVFGLISTFFTEMIVGGAVGYFTGRFAIIIFNKLKLEFDGLYTVMSLAIVLLIYSLTQILHGNGFLAVYVAGIVLGNAHFIHKNSIVLLHDGVSWLMQSCLFLTLGLLIFPSRVMEVTGLGLVVALFLIFVARPFSVFLSLSLSNFNWREKTLISWVGLRESVPIVLATYPLVAKIERADFIFNLVFFVALTSLILQGSSISFMAKLLKVELKVPSENPVDVIKAINPSKLTPVLVPGNSEIIDKSIVDLNLPEDFLIVIIERLGKTVIPRGATQIHAGDKLYVLAEKPALKIFEDKLNAPALDRT